LERTVIGVPAPTQSSSISAVSPALVAPAVPAEGMTDDSDTRSQMAPAAAARAAATCHPSRCVAGWDC
jgi:hypothetical protein